MIDITEYNMPAEWEKHARTLISWPVKSSLTNPQNYEAIRDAYAALVNAVCEFEPVTVIANEDTAEEPRSLCSSQADIITAPHDDAWIRDNGPIFVRNQNNELAGLDWRFNAWGEKYSPYYLDDELTDALLLKFDIPCYFSNMILEGGSIHVDGDGTLLTTEQCLLNRNRNSSFLKKEVEDELLKGFGVKKIIWLNNGLFGDETDGHIDNIACFAKPGTILLQTCNDMNDINHNISVEARNILRRETDAAGRKPEVIEIEQPPARKLNDRRLALSYINFYLVNGGLILPVFGGDAAKTDENATAILKEAFPDRKIITFDGSKLITEGGNVHCITQQMPEGINAV